MGQTASDHCSNIQRSKHQHATLENMESHVRWPTMTKDGQQYLDMYLLCKATEPGEVMPVLFAETLQSDNPRESLHIDFLYMGPSLTGELIARISKDDASMYSLADCDQEGRCRRSGQCTDAVECGFWHKYNLDLRPSLAF
jgi:hypothetical protein